MCRSIKPLFNYDPPASEADIEAAARQYVRKVSGMRKPSQVNQAAFERAIAEIGRSTAQLLAALETKAPARNRAAEIAKAREQAAKRYA